VKFNVVHGDALAESPWTTGVFGGIPWVYCNFPAAGVQSAMPDGCPAFASCGNCLGGLNVKNYFAMDMDRRQADGVSALGLAHLGDGVYELLVRAWLCGHGGSKVGNLHRQTVSNVSAPA